MAHLSAPRAWHWTLTFMMPQPVPTYLLKHLTNREQSELSTLTQVWGLLPISPASCPRHLQRPEHLGTTAP